MSNPIAPVHLGSERPETNQMNQIKTRFSQMRYEIDELKKDLFVSSDAKSRLAIISTELQMLVKMLSQILTDNSEEEKIERRETRLKFKGLIEEVKELIDALEKNKKSSDEQEDEIYLKLPQSLQGYLKKQG
jgi:hypothetical protein